MKRNQPALMLGALGILTSSLAFAQNFQTMPIQSGLTADVIANGVGSATTSTTTDVDGVSYAFVSQDFQATARVLLLRTVFRQTGLSTVL